MPQNPASWLPLGEAGCEADWKGREWNPAGQRPPDGKPSLAREGARRADGMINVFPALPIQDAYEEQVRHAAGPHLPWMEAAEKVHHENDDGE